MIDVNVSFANKTSFTGVLNGRFDLTNHEWSIIEPLLPKRGRGPARLDDRIILNGIFYILRARAPWRERGVWKGIFDALAQESEDTLIFIDAMIVKTHRAAAGSKKGSFKTVLDAHAALAQAKFTWT